MADDTLLARLTASRLTRPESVVTRSFAAETVVLNLDSGMYHGLNPTAARMFDHLIEAGDFEATATQLAAEYDTDEATIRSDLAELCGQLLDRGLLIAEPAG